MMLVEQSVGVSPKPQEFGILKDRQPSLLAGQRSGALILVI